MAGLFLMMSYVTSSFAQPAGSTCEKAIFLPPPAETCSQSSEHMPPKEKERFFTFSANNSVIEITIAQANKGSDAEIIKLSAYDGACSNLNLLKETQQKINGVLSIRLENLIPGQECIIKVERLKEKQGGFEMCVKEIEEALPFGLQHTPLGNAVLTPVNNTLVISNVGSTGNDGVSINIGGANFHIEGEISDNAPIGSIMVSDGFGKFNGIPNQKILTITRELTANGRILTADFTPINSPTYELRAFLNGSLIHTQSGMSGIVGELILPQAAKKKFRCCLHTGCKGIRYSIPLGIAAQLNISGGPVITTDFFVLVAENQINKPDFLSGMNIRGKNVGDFTIENEWVIFEDDIEAEIPHRSLGDANLKAVIGDFTKGGVLTVSNVGSTGQDGVQIDFIDFIVGKNVESFVYDVELTDATTFPLGATMSSSSKAQINGVPNLPAGSMTLERVPGGFEITPDYSAVGANSYEFQLFNSGSLVFSQSVKTGSAAIVQVNDGGNPPNRKSKCKFCCNNKLRYSWNLGATKIVKVTNGPTLSADLLVFKPVNPSVQELDFFNSIDVTARDIPFFDIVFESTAISQNLLKQGNVEDVEEGLTNEGINQEDMGKKELGFILESYPNPFSNFVNFEFSLPNTERITMEIYDITGKKVTTLFNQVVQENQIYTIKFDAEGLKDGIYFYRFSTNNKKYIGRVAKIN